jgi:hypothetical protein
MFEFEFEGSNRIAVKSGIVNVNDIPNIVTAAQATDAAAVQITVANADYADKMSRLRGFGFECVGGNEIDGVRVTVMRRIFADRYVQPQVPERSSVNFPMAIEPLVARSLQAYRENRESAPDSVKSHFII